MALPHTAIPGDLLPAELRPAQSARSAFLEEITRTARIGAPLALGELGWISTYIVDALLIGRLPHSAPAIAASSLGNTIYYAIAFFAVYMLNGLEAYIAQAAGRGDRQECVRMLMQSMWIVIAGTPLVIIGTLASASALPHFGVAPEITAQTKSYLHALVWSTAPLMLYMAIRRFLQSINKVLLISVSLITSGAVNWFFDWLLLYGHWHMPAMGIAGSGWATVAVRFWMLLVLLPGTVLAFRKLNVWPTLHSLLPDRDGLWGLVRIGFPSGLEFSLELGISTFMSVLCARLGTTLLAAHQVTLDLNAFVYMVPAGLSYAAMIHVGQAAGRNDLQGVQRAANATLLIAVIYSALAGVTFLTFAHGMAGLYSNDPHVVSAAVPLLSICSILILADAAFVIHASALTGLGDTRTPMWVSIICNWGLGMPAAWFLAFPLRHGVLGLWLGRAIASVSSGLLLTALWRYRMSAQEKGSRTHTLTLLTPLRAH